MKIPTDRGYYWHRIMQVLESGESRVDRDWHLIFVDGERIIDMPISPQHVSEEFPSDYKDKPEENIVHHFEPVPRPPRMHPVVGRILRLSRFYHEKGRPAVRGQPAMPPGNYWFIVHRMSGRVFHYCYTDLNYAHKAMSNLEEKWSDLIDIWNFKFDRNRAQICAKTL